MNTKILIISFFSILIIGFFPLQNAFADVVTFISSDDTWLSSTNPSQNHNMQPDFAAGKGSPPIAHGVVAFDISSISPGSSITSVELKLESSFDDSIANLPVTLSLQKITTSWDESSTTWNSPWITAGGDFIGTSSASQTVTGLGPFTWGSTSQMVSDVQGWVDNPSSNNGWLLKLPDESGSTNFARFIQNTGSDDEVPMLTVTFNPSSPQPVGGEMIPINTTMVFLAGTQMTAVWVIPVIVSAVGIGIVIARKF